jgi:hypothetical protein
VIYYDVTDHTENNDKELEDEFEEDLEDIFDNENDELNYADD